MIKNFKIFVVLIVVSINSIYGQDKLSNELNDLLKDPYFLNCQAAITVYDLSSRTTVYNRNEKLLLMPASNMKILTSIAALRFLGAKAVFETKVLYNGEIQNDGTLKGDLIIKGGGDPEFSVSDLDKIIIILRNNKINKIDGDIIADISFKDSLFLGEGWMWDDDTSPDAPYLSALNINRNLVEVSVVPGALNGIPKVSITPPTSFFTVSNYAVTLSNPDKKLIVSRDFINRTNEILIKGQISSNSNKISSEMNVWNPELYFLTLFAEKLKSNGFKFTDSLKVSSKDAEGILIGSVTNSISKTLTQLNKRSTNLNAEMLLLLMGRLKSENNISFRDGIEFVDSLINLSGLNAKDYRVSDGSGVSRYNLVSAELLTKLLIYIYDYDKNLFNLFFSTLPVSGIDGTLSYRMSNSIAKGKVFAKTGTLSGVSTLSGYIKRSNGNYFVFSILLQNYTSPSRIARDYIDKICEIITKH